MKRRQFIQLALASMVFGPAKLDAAVRQIQPARKWKTVYNPPKYTHQKAVVKPIAVAGHNIRDYLTKIRNPDRPHRNDIILGACPRTSKLYLRNCPT